MEKFFIRDAIYDEIPVYRPVEESIINDWVLQRLRYIKQLQLTYLVYPSATHTRFEHSLGVMHTASEFISHVFDDNSIEEFMKKLDVKASEKEFELLVRLTVRLAGLLHDIGHGPLGHLFDDVIIPTVAGEHKDLLKRRCFSHEVLGFVIYWRRIRDKIMNNLKKTDFSPELSDLLLRWLDQILVPICFEDGRLIYHKIFGVEESGFGYSLRMIVRDFLYTADMLDYLVRDSVYTGAVELGSINRVRLMRGVRLIHKDRLVEKLRSKEIRAREALSSLNDELLAHIPSPYIIFIKNKIVPDLVRYLHARRLMYENVYLHHVVEAFQWSVQELLLDDIVWYEIVGIDKKSFANLIVDLVNNPMKDSIDNLIKIYLGLTDHILLRAKEVVEKLIVPSSSVVKSIESIFTNRKPKYKLLAKEFINSLPTYTRESSSQERKRVEDWLRDEILKETGLSQVDMRLVIDKVDIYPGSAWTIQGPYIYSLPDMDSAFRLETISEFSRKNMLSNIGEVRLFVDREVSDDVKRGISEAFDRVMRSEGVRRDLEHLIERTTETYVTM